MFLFSRLLYRHSLTYEYWVFTLLNIHLVSPSLHPSVVIVDTWVVGKTIAWGIVWGILIEEILIFCISIAGRPIATLDCFAEHLSGLNSGVENHFSVSGVVSAIHRTTRQIDDSPGPFQFSFPAIESLPVPQDRSYRGMGLLETPCQDNDVPSPFNEPFREDASKKPRPAGNHHFLMCAQIRLTRLRTLW